MDSPLFIQDGTSALVTLTIRDLFALAAMHARLSRSDYIFTSSVADEAYDVADEMMRKRGETTH